MTVSSTVLADARHVDNKSATIVSLQILRAIAALMVVLFHVLATRAGTVDGEGFLNSGVDLFFLISGFIMVRITSRGSRDPIHFLKNRLVRVVPLYWFATLSWLAVISITGSAFPKLSELALSMAFIPYFNQAGDPMPVLGLGWTLNYEIFFYIVFAVTMFMRPARQIAATACLFIVLISLRPIIGATSGAGFRFTSPLFLEFIMGASAAIAFPRFSRIPLYVGVASIAIGIAMLFALSNYGLPRFISKGGPHMFVMVGALILEPWALRSRLAQPLRHVGDASYSIYLFHAFALSLVPFFFASSTTALGRWFVLLPCAVGAGLVAHKYVERPLLVFFGSRLRRL